MPLHTENRPRTDTHIQMHINTHIHKGDTGESYAPTGDTYTQIHTNRYTCIYLQYTCMHTQKNYKRESYASRGNTDITQ